MALMKDGDLVEVRLHGDESWYPGLVMNARKQWVQLDPVKYPGGHFVADESSIAEWRPAREVW